MVEQVFGYAMFLSKYNNTDGECKDLDLAEDKKDVLQAYQALGISNITVLDDPTYDEVEDLHDRVIVERYKEAKRTGKKTAFFFWIASHAEMRGATTQMRLNSKDPEKKFYPLELNLMMRTNTPGTFTFVGFDCCRVFTSS